MTDSASPPGAPDAPRTCENCRTVLQGGYCHLCGQSEQSPVRHLGHALEEVFESFWHLDGRIFRTLRGLWVPGRIAGQYLSGHRVRYVAPMRLFVILTALAFFVAQFLVDPAAGPRHSGGDVGVAIAQIEEAGSVAEVERIRDGLLAELAGAREQVPAFLPGLDAGMVSAGGATRRAAAARIQALRAAAGDAPPAGADPDAAVASADPPGPSAADPADWGHPERLDRMNRNLQQLMDDPRGFVRALLGAAPMALFITVPLFAVMLRLAYLFQRRLYLEHLTVALYSHAWLMLVLLLYFASVLAGAWLTPRAGPVAAPLGWLQAALLALMPLYLLLMQKRVYRQSWPVTLLKYAALGLAYLVLVGIVTFAVSIYVVATM